MCWTTISSGGMAMIADSRVVRCEQFLANVTSRRARICLPLLFRQRFHGHVGGYNTFYTMRQVLELSHKPRYTIFIATESI